MPKQRSPSRKISVDLPLDLWDRYQEFGDNYGMKIKDFVLGAFEAVDFLDKFLSETLTGDQIKDISPLLRRSLEKYETLYCGKSRSRNLDKPKVIYFDKNNDQHPDFELQVRTHDIVKDFNQKDDYINELLEMKSKRSEKFLEELIMR